MVNGSTVSSSDRTRIGTLARSCSGSYAVPVMSVIEGHALNDLFQTYYGDVHIEDLWTSFFCMASNLTQ